MPKTGKTSPFVAFFVPGSEMAQQGLSQRGRYAKEKKKRIFEEFSKKLVEEELYEGHIVLVTGPVPVRPEPETHKEKEGVIRRALKKYIQELWKHSK